MSDFSGFAQLLQELYGPLSRSLAYSTGFRQRYSKLDGPALLQAMAGGWAANPAASRAELAVMAGCSKQALDQALTADTRYWAALLSNDGVAVVLTVAAGTSAKSIHWGAAEPFGVIQPVSAVNSSQNYGALPNTFPTAGLFLGGVNPMVALGFSAVI